jgi:hypothetical protein
MRGKRISQSTIAGGDSGAPLTHCQKSEGIARQEIATLPQLKASRIDPAKSSALRINSRLGLHRLFMAHFLL